MAKVNYIEKILDEVMFSCGGKSKYSLKYISQNKGNYPVYSAKTTGDRNKGYINSYDYDVECLQITTDGAKAGTIIYRKKQKFSVGPATRIWLIKDNIKNLDIRYIENILRNTFNNKDFSWRNKASLFKIENIKINIPVKENGEFDLDKQEEIVKQYKLIEDKKIEIKEKLDYINSVEVDFISNELKNTKSYKIKDIFDLSIGTNSSSFTKTFIKNNKGNIPVYGASKEDIPSYGYVKDNAEIIDENIKIKYYEDCLTYNIDGLAGYVFYRKGKFSLSEKVRPLIIRDEFKEKLNPIFLKYIIEPIFRKNIKGRLAENGKNEYTKLYQKMIEDIEIEIPITKVGELDLEKQNKIVEKYELIYEMKEKITQKGLPFTLANISLNELNPYIYIYIATNKMFDIVRGKSKYTKIYCKNNNGDYPVYSADNNLPLGYMNSYDYSGKYLTISVNGIAGVITILNENFSVNADRVILIPKMEKINLEYIFSVLEYRLRDKAKGRKGLGRKNEFTKLTNTMIEEIEIPIPFNINGEIDEKIQLDIANKYSSIFNIKKKLSKQINNILNSDILI